MLDSQLFVAFADFLLTITFILKTEETNTPLRIDQILH